MLATKKIHGEHLQYSIDFQKTVYRKKFISVGVYHYRQSVQAHEHFRNQPLINWTRDPGTNDTLRVASDVGPILAQHGWWLSLQAVEDTEVTQMGPLHVARIDLPCRAGQPSVRSAQQHQKLKPALQEL